MNNLFLDILKSQIGEKLTKSPSNVGIWLNGTLIAVEKGYVEVKFIVRNDWLNPANTLHGGITATIFDDVIGMTVFTTGDPYFYSSINLNVDFLSVVFENQELVVKTKIIKHGKNIINAEATLYTGEKLVARAVSNLFKTEHLIKI